MTPNVHTVSKNVPKVTGKKSETRTDMYRWWFTFDTVTKI